MSETKEETQDRKMTELLLAESPFGLGIPAWFIREISHRDDQPVSAIEILGKKGQLPDDSLVTNSLEVVGYEFSWGTLFEHILAEGSPDSDWEGPACVSFGVFPQELLRRHPYFETVGEVFEMVMAKDPNFPEAFDLQDVGCDWSIMRITAWTDEDGASLRYWMAETFIPTILPKLIVEADRIMTLISTGNMATDPMADYLYNKWWCAMKRIAEVEMLIRDESGVTCH